MKEIEKMLEHFALLETTEEHRGYFFSVQEAIVIVILGSLCGLESVHEIHQWAREDIVKEFLIKELKIKKTPSYVWLLNLLSIIKPESLNKCFINWIETLLPEDKAGLTIAMDGKSINSTGNLFEGNKPLNIVSAYIAELGVTFGQQVVSTESNEIPAVRELIEQLNLEAVFSIQSTVFRHF